MRLLEDIDPRLQADLRLEWERRRAAPVEPLPRGVTVVLSGHRAAGKSRLLGPVAAMLGRPAVDLDAELERRSRRSLREWVKADQPGFRAAEQAVFHSLPRGGVVAVGGGFLATHPDALVDCLTVLVPISFETYRERLLADATRPRLRPELSLEDELRQVFDEREVLHRRAHPMSLVDFVLRLERGVRPRRVVTLPPHVEALAFAGRAKQQGADLLEVRSDLSPAELPLEPLARVLPLLVSQRTPSLPPAWVSHATLIDRPLGGPLEGPRLLVSLHADDPLTPEEAVRQWQGIPEGAFVKHVEPLGPLPQASRLLETRARLAERFGAERVTVLATGAFALPFRAVLAVDNALDYLALDVGWAAAPGQRWLADATREWRRPSADRRTARLGIVGHPVAHSMSPRVHPAPFDRIDLPEDVELAPILEALRPFYRGFAVTTPFKRRAARAVSASIDAVNTLIRTPTGWAGSSSDADGAGAVLEALGAKVVTVLGQGGVATALQTAADARGVSLRFLKAAQVTAEPVRGAVVWSWPADRTPPETLRFEGATVAIIAYGAPGKRVAQEVRQRGGVPRRLGARWFIAQARAQRARWPREAVAPSERDAG